MGLQVKKSIRALLVGAIMFAMVIGVFPAQQQQVKAASDAVINLSTKYQEIQGYGGMNHPSWAGDLTASQRETAFGNSTNQLGFSVLRILLIQTVIIGIRKWLRQKQPSLRAQLFLRHLGIRQVICVKHLIIMVIQKQNDLDMTNMLNMQII